MVINLHMQSVLYDSFEQGVAHYLEFLLGFIMRDSDSRKLSILKEL